MIHSISRRAIALCLLLGLCSPALAQEPRKTVSSEGELRAEFKKRLAAWYDASEGTRSTLGVDLTAYERLIQMGPRSVPFLVEELEALGHNYGHRGLPSVVQKITKKKLTGTSAEEVVTWWKSRGRTPDLFETHFARWKSERSRGASVLRTDQIVVSFEEHQLVPRKTTKTEPLGEAYDGMRDLGIDVLPLIATKLKEGHNDMLLLFSELTDGKGDPGRLADTPTRVKLALEWWEANKRDWLLPLVSAAKLKVSKP